MSADACVVFYGVRYDLGREEIPGLEARSDARIAAARRAGLKYYWANFSSPGERYLLFIGSELAILGPENTLELSLSSDALHNVMQSTKEKLLAANLAGEPSLFLQWQADI